MNRNDELWTLDACELAQGIRTGQFSSREAVTSCLERLDAVNSRVNAVTVVFAEQALAEADQADQKRRRGEPLGSLHGIPVTLKENVDLKGSATTMGVPALQDSIAESDSPAVANWKRAGAIVIGRTNTSPFAMRWHTDNELRGPTLNPWDKKLTPGGSSGGAGAAVAVGIGPLAHGTDLGGSIRFPAYCCGVCGIRPTLGRVPAFNGTAAEERPLVVQLCAVQGLLARRARDLRLGLAAMTAYDARDPWWVPAPLRSPDPVRPIRVALTTNPAGLGIDPAVEDALRRAGRALENAGYAVEEVDPPSVEAIADLWWRLTWNEMRHLQAPVMRRLGDKKIIRTTELYLASAPEADLVGYMRDWASRATHLRAWLLFLERYPLILGPVSTELPFAADFDIDESADAGAQKRAFRLMITVNLLGLPAVATPTGLCNGVPAGVQVIGSRYREDLCLDAAEAIEAQCGLETPINATWPSNAS